MDFKEETAFSGLPDGGDALEAYKKVGQSSGAAPQNKVIAGFSLEALLDLFRAINPDNPIQVLTDAILAELRAWPSCGCNNLRTPRTGTI